MFSQTRPDCTHVLVSADWMKSCGYPARDTLMTVTCIKGCVSGWGWFYGVVRANGQPWIVCDIRLVTTFKLDSNDLSAG